MNAEQVSFLAGTDALGGNVQHHAERGAEVQHGTEPSHSPVHLHVVK